ncbi:MAG: hypothetical protein HY290_21050 [Planctomycetia bacterium]|nr:hypothetical protein [Planctomycetia bacterium]
MRKLPAIFVFAAAGAGYLYTHPDLARGITSTSWITSEGEVASSARGAASPEVVARLATATKEEVIAVPGPEVSDFGDVFRFDLSPQAITQRWSRVSTVLSDMQLQGYRVPLVTGNAESDLAGSLTYYFDGRPLMRRITFVGTTANPQRLVGYMAKYYGFHQVPGNSPRAMVYRTKSGFTRARFSGELTVTPAEVLDKNFASTNYRVVLSLAK